MGLIADIGLAALTAAMIVYAVILDRRLKALRGGLGELAKLVMELTVTTAKADRTLAAFRLVGEKSGQRLEVLVEEARAVADELQFLSERGAKLAPGPGTPPRRGARSAVESELVDALRAAL